MNTSELFSLSQNDFIKGAVVALLGGLVCGALTVLHGVISAPGFDLFQIDWGMLGQSVVNAGIVGGEAGFSGYIAKNFLSDSNGALLGVVGGSATTTTTS